MKQAKELQSKMAEMQAEIEQLTRDGTAGAGLVTVTVNGKGEMRALNVDPSLMKPDEKEILEDLIVAAHADAKAKMEEALQEKMKDMTGGLPLPPGMKF
jgi:hypothetical protein